MLCLIGNNFNRQPQVSSDFLQIQNLMRSRLAHGSPLVCPAMSYSNIRSCKSRSRTGGFSRRGGFTPKSRSPNEIDRFDVLEANWTGLGDPTHGVVVGDNFYFIANSGWDRVGENGAFKPGAAAEIWKLRL
jgi:hypothetical protein